MASYPVQWKSSSLGGYHTSPTSSIPDTSGRRTFSRHGSTKREPKYTADERTRSTVEKRIAEHRQKLRRDIDEETDTDEKLLLGVFDDMLREAVHPMRPFPPGSCDRDDCFVCKWLPSDIKIRARSTLTDGLGSQKVPVPFYLELGFLDTFMELLSPSPSPGEKLIDIFMDLVPPSSYEIMKYMLESVGPLFDNSGPDLGIDRDSEILLQELICRHQSPKVFD